MKKVTIYGERCSGTNYLEELLMLNFDVEITWAYGSKHFFGFRNLSNSDDVLFIGIIRNLYDWINSLYREKHHLPLMLTKNEDNFMNNEFYSVYEHDSENLEERHIYSFINNETYTFHEENEIITDRNIETNERYKNIFELRLVKNKFLINKMPNLVKNYCLITYEELTTNFIDIMNKLKGYGLEKKTGIEFPLNISYYKKNKNYTFKKKVNEISKEIIDKMIMKDKELLFYENLLFPDINRCT